MRRCLPDVQIPCQDFFECLPPPDGRGCGGRGCRPRSGSVLVSPSMALPSSSTPTSSNWPLNPVIPVSGFRTPMVSSTRSDGFGVGFAVQVQGVGDGFRERREGFRFGHRTGLHEDLLRLRQHPGVSLPGRTLDRGHHNPGLVDTDGAVGQRGGELREYRVRNSCRRVAVGVGPWSRCSPWPGRPGRRSSAFPAAARRWTRIRSSPRCAGCRSPRPPAPARRTPTGPAPRSTAPIPADRARGSSELQLLQVPQSDSRGRDSASAESRTVSIPIPRTYPRAPTVPLLQRFSRFARINWTHAEQVTWR